MGWVKIGEWEHASEEKMKEVLDEMQKKYDPDGRQHPGWWRQKVYNDHVRTITEKVSREKRIKDLIERGKNRKIRDEILRAALEEAADIWIVRSLIRSRMSYTCPKELDLDPFWEGIIFLRNRPSNITKPIVRLRELDECEFREQYRMFGGIAKW